jgi:hypothetical protein
VRGARAKQLRKLAYQDQVTKSKATEYSGERIRFINPLTKGSAGEFEMIQLTSIGPRRKYRQLKDHYKRLRAAKTH